MLYLQPPSRVYVCISNFTHVLFVRNFVAGLAQFPGEIKYLPQVCINKSGAEGWVLLPNQYSKNKWECIEFENYTFTSPLN